MNILELCEKIELQMEIKKEIEIYYHDFDWENLNVYLHKLKNLEEEAETRKQLSQIFMTDEKRIKILTCMLTCAAQLYDWYIEKGISETIFIDTMKCFTRFIEECREKTGRYAFDREWWTARQIGGKLFRIGELEYEMCTRNQRRYISVHIPSDAILTEKNCDASLYDARSFFENHFSEYKDADYLCHSWMLAPELKILLNEGSAILKFQSRFCIEEVDYNDTDFFEWIYKVKNMEIKDLPENTTLQKNLKKHLLNGGKLGSARGIILWS